MNLKIPDSNVDKALADLALDIILKDLSRIGWDARGLLTKPLVARLQRYPLGPEMQLMLIAEVEGQPVHCTALVSDMALMVADSPARILSMEMENMARSMVGEILKRYNTTYGDERKRLHENWQEKIKDQNFQIPIFADPTMEPGTMKLVNQDGSQVVMVQKETVKEAVLERKRNAKWKIE